MEQCLSLFGCPLTDDDDSNGDSEAMLTRLTDTGAWTGPKKQMPTRFIAFSALSATKDDTLQHGTSNYRLVRPMILRGIFENMSSGAKLPEQLNLEDVVQSKAPDTTKKDHYQWNLKDTSELYLSGQYELEVRSDLTRTALCVFLLTADKANNPSFDKKAFQLAWKAWHETPDLLKDASAGKTVSLRGSKIQRFDGYLTLAFLLATKYRPVALVYIVMPPPGDAYGNRVRMNSKNYLDQKAESVTLHLLDEDDSKEKLDVVARPLFLYDRAWTQIEHENPNEKYWEYVVPRYRGKGFIPIAHSYDDKQLYNILDTNSSTLHQLTRLYAEGKKLISV